MRETGILSKAKQDQRSEDKVKSKHSVYQLSGNMPHEQRSHANDGISFHPKPSGSRHQHSDKSDKDGELVKYMSKDLPVYLQRTGRGEIAQRMAWNVGVLDWPLLEKWKREQKFDTARDGNGALFSNFSLSNKVTGSSTSTNTVQNERSVCEGMKHPPRGSSINSSQAYHIPLGAKQSFQNSRHLQEFETGNTKKSVDWQRRVPRTYNPSGRNDSEVVSEKEKPKYVKQRIASKVGNLSASSNGKSNLRRKGLDRKITSSTGVASSEVKINDDSYHSKEKKNVCNFEPKKGTKKLQGLTICLSSQHQTGDSNNIILRLPRTHSSNCSPEEPSVSGAEKLTEDSFSHTELHSSKFWSQIPHSWPLPFGDESSIEPCNMRHTVGNTKGAELHTVVCYRSPCLHQMPIRLPVIERGESSIKHETGNKVEISKAMDQEATKFNNEKERDPSPNRRFSFSLSRMTRSFSFKERSTLPQLSSLYISMKSGQVISKASYSDNLNIEKTIGHHTRARSSPLRRILNPLMKSKGFQSSVPAQPSKGSLKSSTNITQWNEKKELEISTVQALLKLTIGNGRHLLRFIVDNHCLLALPLKNLTPPMKNTASCNNYTFYAIDEIKKKSGRWINQGGKEKGCSYVYNVVGQMKVRESSSFDFSGCCPINHCMVKESVLFGVKLRRADQEPPMFMPRGEIAAIVVKRPNWQSSVNTKLREEDGNLMTNDSSSYSPENGCSCNFRENEGSDIVTAILPGAIHGLPNEGVPSSLLHRWKTGGSCDCGGWDVGCKLRILSNENQSCKVPRTSNSCITSDCYELFDQGGTKQDKPIFRLAPLQKGTYAVEFCSSISSLQAFFICVTVMSCKESSDLVERSNLYEEKVFRESKNNDGTTTTRSRSSRQGKSPVIYTPCPPLSPVGRV